LVLALGSRRGRTVRDRITGPVRYASALGEDGIAAYRQAVAAHPGGDSFAARYARERLAVLDGDVDEIVRLLGGDLSTPYRFVRVAEAMAELDRDDETLAWTARGIAETDGWQTAKLYDLGGGSRPSANADAQIRSGAAQLLVEGEHGAAAAGGGKKDATVRHPSPSPGPERRQLHGSVCRDVKHRHVHRLERRIRLLA
jgi:hypothetical protein